MLCLLPLISITFLSVLGGAEFIGIPLDSSFFDYLLINGSEYSEWIKIDDLGISGSFNIDVIAGAIAIIIVIAVIGIGIGINVLGSGLSETTVKLIITAISYTGLWALLSVLASPLLFEIEVFGGVIYIALTLGYTIGVVNKMTGGKGI